MLYKRIIPEASDFGGLQPIEILRFSSKGLDKTASMQKRASAFLDVLALIKPIDKKAYLHVITTGDFLTFGANRNADGWNGHKMVLHPPMAKNASCKEIVTDLGLSKYHSTYMDGAYVYQLHQTKRLGAKPSGIVKAARYNLPMHRGLLLIEVDVEPWRDRLQKHASGQNIFLSVGASLLRDLCPVCGNSARTLKEHCDHITKQARHIFLDGTLACMLNDAPHFYDISGVNVPADQMAFVLRKVASGVSVADAILEAHTCNMTRAGMGVTKAASILSKLAAIEKQIKCSLADDPVFTDDQKTTKDFLSAVENYPTDLIISQCNNKAILLSPEMLFKLLGKETDNREVFDSCANMCPMCGKHLMLEMEEDPLFQRLLYDGSFDLNMPVDINLSSILDRFVGDLGVSRPAVNSRTIRIVIMGLGAPHQSLHNKDQEEVVKQLKSLKSDSLDTKELSKRLDSDSLQDIKKLASALTDELRRTYARYVISFAQKNNDDTCMLAMQKLARYK